MIFLTPGEPSGAMFMPAQQNVAKKLRKSNKTWRFGSNTKLQYTTQTQTSPNGWYNLVLRKSGRVVTIDGTMTLSTSYNAGNVFFSIENTAYQNGGGTPLVFYNRTANTFHMGYITGNHEIQSVSPFTSGDYVICGTWITG